MTNLSILTTNYRFWTFDWMHYFCFSLTTSTMAPSKKSDVWRFFDKTEENKNSAKCRLCQKFIKSCGNTTNLIGHLKNIHKAAYQEFSNECSKKNDIQSNTFKKNTHLSLDPNISDPLPSTSSAGIMTMEMTSNAEKNVTLQKTMYVFLFLQLQNVRNLLWQIF